MASNSSPQHFFLFHESENGEWKPVVPVELQTASFMRTAFAVEQHFDFS